MAFRHDNSLLMLSKLITFVIDQICLHGGSGINICVNRNRICWRIILSVQVFIMGLIIIAFIYIQKLIFFDLLYNILNKKVSSECNISKKNVCCTQLKIIFNTNTIRSTRILIKGKDKLYLLLKIKDVYYIYYDQTQQTKKQIIQFINSCKTLFSASWYLIITRFVLEYFMVKKIRCIIGEYNHNIRLPQQFFQHELLILFLNVCTYIHQECSVFSLP